MTGASATKIMHMQSQGFSGRGFLKFFFPKYCRVISPPLDPYMVKLHDIITLAAYENMHSCTDVLHYSRMIHRCLKLCFIKTR